MSYILKFVILIVCFLCSNSADEQPASQNDETLAKADAILKILDKSHDGEKLYRGLFIENYKAAGGSEESANKIFMLMSDNENVTDIPIEAVEKNMESIVTSQLDPATAKIYREKVDEYKRAMDEEDVAIENNENSDEELELEENKEDEQTKKNMKTIEEEFSRHDHLNAFQEEEDDFPAHEPMYQPSEDDDVDSLYNENGDLNKEATDNEPIQSYDEDFKILTDLQKEQPEEPEVLYEQMDDHEPVYQPEDQGEEPKEHLSGDKKMDEDIVPDVFVSTDESQDEEESLFSDEDENEDGYPDHEPIYQPEDETMSASSMASGKIVVDDGTKNKRVEL